jgi:hypothetical protein
MVPTGFSCSPAESGPIVWTHKFLTTALFFGWCWIVYVLYIRREGSETVIRRLAPFIFCRKIGTQDCSEIG